MKVKIKVKIKMRYQIHQVIEREFEGDLDTIECDAIRNKLINTEDDTDDDDIITYCEEEYNELTQTQNRNIHYERDILNLTVEEVK